MLRRVVDTKYGSLWWGWCYKKSIKKGWDTFHCFISFKVGDDSSITLWHDSWCGGPSLKDTFPELYGIACNKDASVVKLISFSGDSYHWNVSFIQLVQDWESRVSCLLYGFDLFWSVERGWNR